MTTAFDCPCTSASGTICVVLLKALPEAIEENPEADNLIGGFDNTTAYRMWEERPLDDQDKIRLLKLGLELIKLLAFDGAERQARNELLLA
ncbi:hypothetical protein AK830_g2821 [Neonectria ditissima]|uniref:Uncharacterized protein n=1 Tax=Neonectria ditissima TaxID=78410 RepID=A0A0P7BDT1_9HYPO|nr:hypothetical protein AK830_g2821 [Neonectria ditissima]